MAITDLPSQGGLSFPPIHSSLRYNTEKLITLGMGGGRPRFGPFPNRMPFFAKLPVLLSPLDRGFPAQSVLIPLAELVALPSLPRIVRLLILVCVAVVLVLLSLGRLVFLSNRLVGLVCL